MSHAGATIIASPEVTDEACFSVPAVRALHYANPGTPIYVTAPEDIAPLWETVSEVTGVIPHNGSARKIAKELRDFSESLAWAPGPAAIAFSKAGIPKRIGPSTAKLEKFLTDPIVIEQKESPLEVVACKSQKETDDGLRTSSTEQMNSPRIEYM